MKCKEIQEKNNLQSYKKKQKLKEKGITLIALVVTIIILLILVGVTITFGSGENGLITKAKEARKAQIIGETKEAIGLEITEAYTEATLRREELEKKQVEDIVSKYGELQKDGDTIITKKDGYEISLKEIYSGVLSESGSYSAKLEQIEMLEKELEELKENYKILEEANSGNTEEMKKLQGQIDSLTTEKEKVEEELKTEKANSKKEKEELEKRVAELENENTTLKGTPRGRIDLGTGRSINVKAELEKLGYDSEVYKKLSRENFLIEIGISWTRGSSDKTGSGEFSYWSSGDNLSQTGGYSYTYDSETGILSVTLKDWIWTVSVGVSAMRVNSQGRVSLSCHSYLFV